MEKVESKNEKIRRFGLLLGLAAMLYIAGVIVFIIVY
jgi:hypothetical protein